MTQRLANILNLLVAILIAAPGMAATPPATKVDCEKLFSAPKYEASKIEPSDMLQCVNRGYDPPVGWRPNNGKSPGIKVGGAGGFLNSVVNAPESTARARGANASIKKDRITALCNFPPNIRKTIPPKIELSGACYDFFMGLMKDKDGNTIDSKTQPVTVDENVTCPADSDPDGIYGKKTSIAGGGTFAPESQCGGAIPVSNVRLVLNQQADFMAVIGTNRQASFYRRVNNQYALIHSAAIPYYLCMPDQIDGYMQKTVDLTAPLGQVITYNAGAGKIDVRLQSRQTMDSSYIPPYDQNDPEYYLQIPIDASGMPDVPANCSLQTTYYVLPSARQDITIDPPPGEDGTCSGFSMMPTKYNEPIYSCLAGYTLNTTDHMCYDTATGQKVKPTIKDNFIWKCPDPKNPGKYVTVPNKNSSCLPGNPTINYTTTCPDGTPPDSNMQCTTPVANNTTDKYTIDPVSCGASSAPCNTFGFNVNSTADACRGRQQFVVLNRPNLYYAPGTSATVYATQNQPFTVARTANATQFFVTSQADVSLQPTANPVTFTSGGMMRLKDDSILILNQQAKIEAGAGRITMPYGGEHVSSGGTQIKAFANGAVFTIPANLLPSPIILSVSSSITLPDGLTIPTMNSPYMRESKEKVPE